MPTGIMLTVPCFHLYQLVSGGTMPILHAHRVSFRLNTGESLFSELSFSIDSKLTALVGRNGAGKSVLASILAGECQPDLGSVSCRANLGYFRQQEPNRNKLQSVAQFMEVEHQLLALDRVEQGQASLEDIDTIGDNWHIRETLESQLLAINLNHTLHCPCAQLSGGEMAKLRLQKLFNSDADLLILDEPSNHLDNQGKSWLIEQIQGSTAQILIISHDREILNYVEVIYELNTLGLTQHRGNYTSYEAQKRSRLNAIDRKLANEKLKHKQIRQQAQMSHEKAQKRAASGTRLRRSGSQAKVLLNTMRDRAEQSASTRATQRDNQLSQNAATLAELTQQRETLKPQTLHLNSVIEKQHLQLRVEELTLPYNSINPLNFLLSTGDKLHLSGNNGTGKSTLIKVLLGELAPATGLVYRNTPLFYLDQYFDLLKSDLSLLENISHYCPALDEYQSRTLLAGIGFRAQSVHRNVHLLSGGEKMKLCILIVTNQTPLPLLLLDEPDNHLDIASKQLLATALNQYPGSFILVSHDKAFIKESGVTCIQALSN